MSREQTDWAMPQTNWSCPVVVRKLKVDCLETDKRFVSMIGKDASSTHIMESILPLSEKNLSVVAEGVEMPERQKSRKELKSNICKATYIAALTS
ncbi:hypothetical protein [Pseudomonas chlororaphis]|uniref:hypothetical protein n=1 Tax=Pseudomonas chlororaphis TaxID=587753 RepID=UPI0015DE1138|nr:hypothetical protein [Pseudomonas chlororaphis]QLL16103.1 hypothetical protein H0I86_13875 [Pseudomonas chlororaphis subsp. aurantiaca]